MATFEVRWEGARDDAGPHDLGATLYIQTDDWMHALSNAIERYGLERDTINRVVCLLSDHGTIDVSDPDSGSRFVLRQVEGDNHPIDRPSRESSSNGRVSQGIDAPSWHPSRVGSSLGPTDEAVLQRLAADLAKLPTGGSVHARSLAALDILLRYVPAESASVLRLDSAAACVRFEAVRGPAAGPLKGVTVPVGRGIVGVVMRTGSSVLVQEPAQNADHFGAIDITSGYRTRTLLACPVRLRGQVIGAVELLNPFGGGRFSETHRQAAELAARRIGALLRTAS
ncbi:MAG: GAF domain-containing protein [Oligoflexia bacterium]|nr:GAF domain-containing protein [Oligoflexia bacterium]